MTTKQEIESAVAEWSGTDRALLPDWLRNPSPEDQHRLNLAMAVLFSQDQQYAEVSPIYDDQDRLTGWQGIGLK
jgi:hypothetical protein